MGKLLNVALASIACGYACACVYIFAQRSPYWLDALTKPLVPPPSFFTTVLPLFAFWLASLWLAHQFKVRHIPTALMLLLPLVVNFDLISKGLYTVRYMDALTKFNPEVSVWRFLLAFLAMAIHLVKRGSSVHCMSWSTMRDGSDCFKYRVDGAGMCWTSFLIFLGYFLYVVVGYAFLLLGGWLMGYSNVETFTWAFGHHLWVAGRALNLASAYTAASIASIFHPLVPLIKMELITLPFPFIYLAALSGPIVFGVELAYGERVVIKPYKPSPEFERLVERLKKKLEEERSASPQRPASSFRPPSPEPPSTPRVASEPARAGSGEPKEPPRPFVGEPITFSYFTADNGGDARRAANARGLVALFCGAAKWSLEGGKYEYFAITEELAERILSGGRITADEKRMLARWIQSGELEVSERNGEFYVKVKDKRLAADLKQQLESIRMTRAFKDVASRGPDYVR